MPRSFLVKKHLSYKKPNYGELDSKEKEDHKPPYSPGECLEAWPVPCTLHPPEGWLYGSLAMATAETPPKTDAIAAPQIDARPQRIEFPQESQLPKPSFPRPVALEGSLPGPLETRPFALREEQGGVRTAFLGLSPGNQGRVQCFDCHHEAYLAFPGLARRRPPLTLQPLADCDWLCHKYFSCKYCDKEYVSLGALKMHIRTHTLPCVCHLCGKAFSRPWLLQGHIRTHTGEKPFSCPHCSRAFADRSNLRAHLQTHSDVKKYQCTGCSKTFSRISLLSKHEEAGCCPLS